jgi:CRP/FNR family cyclic AMP-dependent transcriptional regulator
MQERSVSGLESFFNDGRLHKYRKKQQIVRLQDDAGYVYRIDSGFVKVCSYAEDGSERSLHIYCSGEIFPVVNLFEVYYQPIYFVAFTDVELRARLRSDLLRYIDHNAQAALELVRQQINFYSPIVGMHLSSAEHKVVFALSDMTRRFGDDEGDYVRINLPFTQQDLADNINLSRETTGKVLSKLESAGYIVRSRQSTLVHKQRLSKKMSEINS